MAYASLKKWEHPHLEIGTPSYTTGKLRQPMIRRLFIHLIEAHIT